MTVIKQNLDLRHLLYPSCPYNNSVIVLALRLSLIALGTVGITFFNIWVAVLYLVYSAWFNLFVWPIKHCQYCYYKIREASVDGDTGKTILTLLSIDEWKETQLEKHVDCAKKWFFHSYILWLGPIVLIPISFLWNFSPFALISLIGFIGVLAGTLSYVRFRVCKTCAFMEECYAAF
ncbi:MAG: hypothetical protein ACFFAE_12015 [Candidatus Hodarchaeota archaeon]